MVLVAGLAFHQIIEASKYRDAEERQNYRRILTPGPRGNIFDREGRLLVGNRPVFNAVVSLNELRKDFRAEYYEIVNQARAINQIINRNEINTRARANVVQRYLNQINLIIGRHESVNSQKLERHFSQSLLLPYPLVSDLQATEYARLIEQIPVDSPIQVITESARYYPYNSAAVHILGFVSASTEIPASEVPGEDLLTFTFEGKVGRSGLERSFDQYLQGTSGGEIWSVDPGGFQFERIEFRSPQKGHDLVTSIDIDLQVIAEEAMGQKSGAVVALDVNTGEVLAMASKPNYNLNDLSPFLSYTTDQTIRDEGGWLNRATQGVYPPGSTFKVITAIAALRNGIVDQHTVINCPGYYLVGRRSFRCNRHSGHGPENLIQSLRDSCNVFFYDRGIATGVENIAAESRRFHLHEPTGIELPGETHSMLVPDPAYKKKRFYESWSGGDTANLSIGQGFLLVTPLQMARVVASIAKNDLSIKPTLIRSGATLQKNVQQENGIGLPPAQLQLIRDGMIAAGSSGTARLAGSPNMPIAGKTGTAQVRKDGQPTTLAWFIGYMPVDNPEIAIAVLIEGAPEQDTNYGGGSTAGPIAKKIFQTYTQKRAPLISSP